MDLSMQDAAQDELSSIIENDSKTVILLADTGKCFFSDDFLIKYDKNIFNFGISEQNLVSAAAGMSIAGLKPIIIDFPCFLVRRALDQITNCIAYPNLNVKIIGMRAGLSERGGCSHTIIEDISILRTIPNMTIVCPHNSNQTKALLRQALEYDGPVYIRVSNEFMRYHINKDYEVHLGGAKVLLKGNDITFITTGIMVPRALLVAKELRNRGISVRVIDLYSIKPFDKNVVLEAAKETKIIITLEEGSIYGGLGGIISELLSETYPKFVYRIGIGDVVTTSGFHDELFSYYGLTKDKILEKVCNIINFN